jgi:hypothetical protein
MLAGRTRSPKASESENSAVSRCGIDAESRVRYQRCAMDVASCSDCPDEQGSAVRGGGGSSTRIGPTRGSSAAAAPTSQTPLRPHNHAGQPGAGQASAQTRAD